MRAIVLAVLLGLAASGCASVNDSIRAHLREWDSYDEAWVDEADLIVLAEYHEREVAIFDRDDPRERIAKRSRFVIEQLIKGEFGGSDIVFEPARRDKRRCQRGFLLGRKYLVFLKPEEKTSQILEGGTKCYPFLIQGDELVAIVDVSRSKREAELDKVEATREGQYEGFVFTPAKWRELRELKTINLAAQGAFVPFLMNVVLTEDADIAHVRSYLGEPDSLLMDSDGICYWYHLNTGTPKRGATSGWLKVHFWLDMSVKSGEVRFCKNVEKGRTSSYDRPLTAAELKELGLPEPCRKSFGE